MEDVYVPPEIIRNILSYRLVPAAARVSRVFQKEEQSLESERMARMDTLYPGWRTDNIAESLIVNQDMDAILMILKYSTNKCIASGIKSRAIKTSKLDILQLLLDKGFDIKSMIYSAIYSQNNLIMKFLMEKLSVEEQKQLVNEVAVDPRKNLQYIIEYGCPYDKQMLLLITKSQKSSYLDGRRSYIQSLA